MKKGFKFIKIEKKVFKYVRKKNANILKYKSNKYKKI